MSIADTWPIVGVPVTRAERYPHVHGPRGDSDGDVETVEATQLTVDWNHVFVGRVTLSAIADPNDAWGYEFDLEPADARELARRLFEAAVGGSEPSQPPRPTGWGATDMASAKWPRRPSKLDPGCCPDRKEGERT